MKNIKYIIICISCMVILSCNNDFIDITPQDRIESDNFFDGTEKSIILTLNGVYAKQRGALGYGGAEGSSLYSMLEARADNVIMNPNEQAERIQLDFFGETPGDNLILASWTKLYDIINLANITIFQSDKLDDSSVLKERLKGEAKFIRALSHFYLVTLWGEVPLRTEPVTDFSKTVKSKSPVDEVYKQIITDLQEASEVLPENYDGSKNNEVGRATKYAALTLLGKVYLQKGDKSKSIEPLTQVKNSGKYVLLSKYSSIHAGANDNTQESIYEISFNPSNGTAFGLVTSLTPLSEAKKFKIDGAGGASGVLFHFPSKSINQAYESGDLRKEASIGITDDSNLYINKFIDYSAKTSGHDTNLVLLRYADVLLMLAEAEGETSQSYAYINEVRARAGLPNIDASTSGTFDEKLLKERRVEFAFEGHRWLDLLRFGKAIEVMSAQLQSDDNYIDKGRNKTVENYRLIFPIPQSEIDVSKNVVTQNNGYN